jgi:serine protease inhibitor
MTRCLAMPSKSSPVEFKADRPFLFFIRERQENIILFSGRFVSPPIAS